MKRTKAPVGTECQSEIWDSESSDTESKAARLAASRPHGLSGSAYLIWILKRLSG